MDLGLTALSHYGRLERSGAHFTLGNNSTATPIETSLWNYYFVWTNIESNGSAVVSFSIFTHLETYFK